MRTRANSHSRSGSSTNFLCPPTLSGATLPVRRLRCDHFTALATLPLFARRTVLVDADAGGIDHHNLAFESGGNRSQKPVPHSSFAPADKPIVARGRGTVALWYLCPWRACSEPPKNTVQHSPVIDAGNAARLVRQQRLNDRPLPVRQFVASPRHPKLLFEALNQPTALPASQFMSLRPRACWTTRPSQHNLMILASGNLGAVYRGGLRCRFRRTFRV